uniref:Uncharacterized protein n=1 Tax=uncultured marine virus TaxID=186617 RepID=A0A0F7LBA7_9VIRU|nr:hypothetical protein [uncultured marine virus]
MLLPACAGPSKVTPCEEFSQCNFILPAGSEFPCPKTFIVCLTLNILEAYEKSGEAPKTPPVSWYCI